MARRPSKPNQWRQSTDLRDFPRSARHVGVKIRVQDSSSLPHTLQGKIELGILLLEQGLIDPNVFYDITEIDTAYGFPRQTTNTATVNQLRSALAGDVPLSGAGLNQGAANV